LLSFPLTVKDHFSIPTRVAVVNVNAEYDNAVPAAALVEPSALMAWADVEADGPVGSQEIIFSRFALADG
jgi:hypothetical protein